jgi:uncharacterized surface protein with fasciclin (FAS1) repeats
LNRLLTAAATVALAAGLAAPQIAAAQAQPKTEAAAAAKTGKVSTDTPASTAVQGTAKAVKDGAAPVATGAAAPAATATAATTLAKPVAVSGDMMDTLRLSGQFTTFVQGLDATNLAGLLKTNKNLTVFAPTDAAFAAMPAADLAKLKSDKAAMQKFLLHHVVNAPIPSSKIKGARGPVPTGAGDQILLDGSDETGALKVDNATIVQADVQTGSGLLQVVDHVLAPGFAASATASGAASPASATATTAAATPPTKP